MRTRSPTPALRVLDWLSLVEGNLEDVLLAGGGLVEGGLVSGREDDAREYAISVHTQ